MNFKLANVDAHNSMPIEDDIKQQEDQLTVPRWDWGSYGEIQRVSLGLLRVVQQGVLGGNTITGNTRVYHGGWRSRGNTTGVTGVTTGGTTGGIRGKYYHG